MEQPLDSVNHPKGPTPSNPSKKTTKKRKLTLKQEDFLNEYLKNGGNGAKAVRKVYNIGGKHGTEHPEQVSHSIASENLSKPLLIEALRNKLLSRNMSLSTAVDNILLIATANDATYANKLEAWKILGRFLGLEKVHVEASGLPFLVQIAPRTPTEEAEIIEKSPACEPMALTPSDDSTSSDRPFPEIHPFTVENGSPNLSRENTFTAKSGEEKFTGPVVEGDGLFSVGQSAYQAGKESVAPKAGSEKDIALSPVISQTSSDKSDTEVNTPQVLVPPIIFPV